MCDSAQSVGEVTLIQSPVISCFFDSNPNFQLQCLVLGSGWLRRIKRRRLVSHEVFLDTIPQDVGALHVELGHEANQIGFFI